MIEQVSNQNLEELLPLVAQYQAFYQVTEISNDKNREFFSQFGESSPWGCQFVFREEGKAIAFATVYFTFTSTIAAKVAVLNDLYVSPDFRRKGIAKKLIDHCRDYAKSKAAVRLQWVTAPENEQAQALYDSMNTNKSTWHFYTYAT